MKKTSKLKFPRLANRSGDLLDWREQFEAIFSNLPLGISYLTPDMRYVRLNPFLEKKLGIKSEDIEGKYCYETVGMYRDDPTRKGAEKICDSCGVHKALVTGEPFKFIGEPRKGVFVENMGVPLKDNEGRIIGAVEIIVDITERVLMEDRLQRHASEMEAAVEKKTGEIFRERDEFITMLTHDLKTPLTSIMGYTSLILNNEMGPVEGDLRLAVEGIKVNSERVLALVRNFLAAGRIQENRLDIEPSPMKIEALILDALRSMEPQVNEKELSVEINFTPNLPKVTIDREQMERVFCNLVSNAIKFTPYGGKITINAYDAGDGYINLDICDTGAGIPRDEIPLLFDKYFQGSNKSQKGTGLGLFIAKNIVEAHQGKIDVTSTDGQGTTFTVKLPQKG